MEQIEELLKIENPRNSAGEFLCYEPDNVKDETVEGTIINGFSNGLIGGTIIEE